MAMSDRRAEMLAQCRIFDRQQAEAQKAMKTEPEMLMDAHSKGVDAMGNCDELSSQGFLLLRLMYDNPHIGINPNQLRNINFATGRAIKELLRLGLISNTFRINADGIRMFEKVEDASNAYR